MKKQIWTLNTVIYGLWVLLVLGSGLYISHWDAMPWQLVGRFWMLLAGIGVLCPLLLKKIREWKPRKHGFGSRLSPWAFRGICFGCSMAVLGFCFLGVLPGGFDGDPRMQTLQVLSGRYNDYYPVAHTLLAFKLPLLLTGDGFPRSFCARFFFSPRH